MSDLFIPHFMILTVILPFIFGILCYAVGRYGALTGMFAALIILGLTTTLICEVYSFGTIRYAIGGWKSPLGIDLYLDGFSALMLQFSAMVGLAIVIYASGYFTKEEKIGAFFWPLWLFAWGSLNALFLSADIFNLYVCLELMTFSVIGLIIIKGSVRAVTAALRYLLLSAIGSLSFLFGVALLYSAYGTLDLIALGSFVEPSLMSFSAMTFITFGLIIKAALFPLHFWLPPAHANAPTPVSAILSGLVVMAAFYLLVRLWFEAFISVINPFHGQLLGILAIFAIFYGSLQALRQSRLKMLIAYSTVAQIGYMFLIFPLVAEHALGEIFAWTGGIYLALSHACAKAAAFMVAGSVIFALQHDRIDELEGLARRFPIGIFTFALAGLSLAGLPPSGGFVGKWLLLKAAMLSGQWWYAVIMICGSLLTVAYFVRVLEVMLRTPKEPKSALIVPKTMQYSALGLSIIAILMGLITSPTLNMTKVGRPQSNLLTNNSKIWFWTSSVLPPCPIPNSSSCLCKQGVP
jgi:formate hydrogenlyase subunit 3/multisubunit Na+/H+ antiporter MnhD subunit